MFRKNSTAYRIIAFTGIQLIGAVEWLIRNNSANEIYYATDTFPWIKKVEQYYNAILSEVTHLLQAGEKIPDFTMLSEEQQRIVEQKKWKSFILKVYGNDVAKNCKQCPETYKALQHIPGISTAMFSVFEAGTELQPHRGVYAGLLRYHLALIIPEDFQACGISIQHITYHWRAGESVVFDDTFEHKAWNNSTEKRVVLFVDFEKPLPFWLRPLNKFMIWLIGSSPIVKNILGNINRLDK
jgi:ornithine lipid ester-linked acyl 2-hydroxylase